MYVIELRNGKVNIAHAKRNLMKFSRRSLFFFLKTYTQLKKRKKKRNVIPQLSFVEHNPFHNVWAQRTGPGAPMRRWVSCGKVGDFPQPPARSEDKRAFVTRRTSPQNLMTFNPLLDKKVRRPNITLRTYHSSGGLDNSQ